MDTWVRWLLEGWLRRVLLSQGYSALKHLAHSAGVEPSLLRAVAAVNNRQRRLPLEMLHARFGDDLKGLQVGVLGLAFKPGTWELAGGL